MKGENYRRFGENHDICCPECDKKRMARPCVIENYGIMEVMCLT